MPNDNVVLENYRNNIKFTMSFYTWVGLLLVLCANVTADKRLKI